MLLVILDHGVNVYNSYIGDLQIKGTILNEKITEFYYSIVKNDREKKYLLSIDNIGPWSQYYQVQTFSRELRGSINRE
jgi:hypothetical protein